MAPTYLRALVLAATISAGLPLEIAIVGAGIGGASLAYFLRESLGEEEATIFVLEAGDEAGGRMASFEFEGRSFEAGATIVHSSNMHIAALALAANLTTEPVGSESEGMGIWAGADDSGAGQGFVLGGGSGFVAGAVLGMRILVSGNY
jgi:prenylcysteine oxidase/farnesylcysteine lyase